MTKARSNAVANAAKGDLTVGSDTNTSAILALGADGSSIVADSAATSGLRYQGSQVAGKNALINGGMDIFQRSSFSTNNAYALDRWYINASTNTTVTQSTAKTTPNSQFMMLLTATGTQQIFAYQAIETKNAIYYAGKTVTLSAYAAGLTTTTNLIMVLSYSTAVDTAVTGSWTDIAVASGNANLTLSSTVTRWGATYNVPADAKSLRVLFVNNAANITVGQGIYLGDTMLEIGSVPTTFARAGGNIQGELAACQRYYFRQGGSNAYQYFGIGIGGSATTAGISINNPVTMRTTPTAIDFSLLAVSDTATLTAVTNITADILSPAVSSVLATVASGLTQFRPYRLLANNSTSAFIGFSAEL